MERKSVMDKITIERLKELQAGGNLKAFSYRSTTLDDKKCSEYAEAMEPWEGKHLGRDAGMNLQKWGHVIIWRELDVHHVADGWHRVIAGISAKIESFDVVYVDTKQAAMLAAATSNLAHGKAMSKAEIRRAFKALVAEFGKTGFPVKPSSKKPVAWTTLFPVTHGTIRNWFDEIEEPAAKKAVREEVKNARGMAVKAKKAAVDMRAVGASKADIKALETVQQNAELRVAEAEKKATNAGIVIGSKGGRKKGSASPPTGPKAERLAPATAAHDWLSALFATKGEAADLEAYGRDYAEHILSELDTKAEAEIVA